jgi:protein TonB
VTGPVRLGGAIETPKKTKNVNPMYPPLARVARIQGTVALECVISPLGEVTEVKVVRSIPLLDAAAIDAVRQWRYAPTLINGVAVSVIMAVPVNFKVAY